ncbi:MAG: hypothetical protein ACYC1M_09740 [Armatimonadota bacterium]
MLLLAARALQSSSTATTEALKGTPTIWGHLSVIIAILALFAVGYYTAKSNKGGQKVEPEDQTDGSVPVCEETWANSRELGTLVEEFDQDGVHVQIYNMWVQIDGLITYHRAFCFLPDKTEPFLIFNLDGAMGCFFFSVHNHRHRIAHAQVHNSVTVAQWRSWAMSMLPRYYKPATE